jgi:MoxR-like ATPase
MKVWIVSPNASNNKDEEPLWKKAIVEKNIVFMGWEEDHQLGLNFINDIKIGDFVLVAQGANWQKKLFVGGFVKSDAKKRLIEGTPREAYCRDLAPTLSKIELEKLSLDFNGSAYGEASLIPAIYQLHPKNNKVDNTIANALENAINKKIIEMDINEKINLLKLKKQIILQGPPGTGKTYLANQIADFLTIGNFREKIHSPRLEQDAEFQDNHILDLLKNIKEIPSATGKTKYGIELKDNRTIRVIGENTKEKGYSITFDGVRKAIKDKLWQGNQKGGNDPFYAAVGKYVYENLPFDKEEQPILSQGEKKLIQFHPAYTYEDFVRGITSHISDGNLEYKVQNKIIADFARKALNNLNDHKKNSTQVSMEKWVESKFEEFKEFVLDEIEEDEKYPISKSAYIFSVDEDGFRYTGDNWANRFRIKDSEFLKLYFSNITERKQIKRNVNIKGRARQHATYFFNLLLKFREFIGNEKPSLNEESEVPLKNFVLIIDEINRANLPAVLGELIYALEYRDCPVESMYELEDEGNTITLPSNLFIIGTMNTADRSVGHIDYAIRRRFAFVPILPSVDVINSVLQDTEVREKAVRLFTEVERLFTSDSIASDFDLKDIQIGHSYFLAQTLKELELKLEFEIKPILREYLKDGILNKTNSAGRSTEELINGLNVN